MVPDKERNLERERKDHPVKISRRKFVKLAGLSSGAALLAGCDKKLTPTLEAVSALVKATATLFQRTPTPEPSSFPIPTPTTGTPLPGEVSVTPPPKELTPEPESKERVTYGKVELYHNPGEAYFSVLIPGKIFVLSGREQDNFVEISVTEKNGMVWTAWIQKTSPYAKIGEVPTAEAPQGRFAKEIVMANGQLEIHNMGSRFGLVVRSDAFRPDKSIAEGAEGQRINQEYIEAMFAKYANGRKLRIYFYDSFARFNKVAQGRGVKANNYYKFGQRVGDAIEYHVGVYENFSPASDNQRILFEIDFMGIGQFLVGQEDSVMNNTQPQQLPTDLENLAYPTRLKVVW